jgi:hypothetical protein
MITNRLATCFPPPLKLGASGRGYDVFLRYKMNYLYFDFIYGLLNVNFLKYTSQKPVSSRLELKTKANYDDM